VIRDAYSDTVLETLNLINRGGQRFSSNWLVAPDPSGMGRDISIVTSVYTDMGYTTKSENYGDEENTHLIEENSPLGKGGGGTGIDARTVRRIMQEEIAKIPEPKEVEMPEPTKIPVMKWDEVLSAITELKTALKPTKPEKIDYKPFNEGIQSILSAVNTKEVTKPTDISPILEKLNEKEETDDITREEIVSILNQLGDALSKELPRHFQKLLSETTFKIAETTARMEVPKPLEEEKGIPFDLSKLSL
jgi:hypothetical protein